jgi:hypothetical protein
MNIGSNADTRFLHPSYNSQSTASPGTANDPVVDWPAPRAGTLRNMFVRHNQNNGNGNAVTYTVFVNGVATTLTVTLATGAIIQGSDLVHSVPIAQGDRVRVQAVKPLGISNGNVFVIVTMELA